MGCKQTASHGNCQGCGYAINLFSHKIFLSCFNLQPVSFMQRLNVGIFFSRASLPVSGGIPFLRPPLTLHEFYNSSHSLKSREFLLFYKACLPFLYSMTDWHFPFIFIYLPLPQYVSAGARKQIQKIRNYAAIASHY